MSSDDDAKLQQARRKFLKVAAYSAPAVVTTVSVNKAFAQGRGPGGPPVSCAPASCHPAGGPCGPTSCPPALGTAPP